MERVSPGPMTNDDIISKEECYTSDQPKDIYNIPLADNARENHEFKVLNKAQWEYLFKRYEGIPLKRYSYKLSDHPFLQVDNKFVKLNLTILPPRDEFDIEKLTPKKPIYVGINWTLKEVRNRLIKVLNGPRYDMKLDENNFRLWRLQSNVGYDKFLKELEKNLDTIKNTKISNEISEVEENTGLQFPGTSINLNDPNKCIEKLSISIHDSIIMERRNSKGEFIFRYEKNLKKGKCDNCYQYGSLALACHCKEVFYCSLKCLRNDEHYHFKKCKAKHDEALAYKETDKSVMGGAGLHNLGNSCYMNSGLQCLSNTTLLTPYFLKDFYLKDINLNNPLGSNGEIVTEYAKLMKTLWYGTEISISPTSFKHVFGKHYKNFEDISQQDSQEFITTLMDSLHEDLNKVKLKPYIENKVVEDYNDNSTANEAWYDYLARNQSVIVDLMHGQYKSVLYCPNCKKYSVTFYPFSMIPLTLPPPKYEVIKFNYVPYDLEKSVVEGAIKIPKKATVDDMRGEIAKLLKVPKYGSTFILLSVNTFDRYLCREQKLKIINKYNSRLYIQEINPKYFTNQEEKRIEELVQSRNIKPTIEGVKETTKDVEMKDTKDDCKMTKNTCPIEGHDDDNNGLSEDMLRVCINIYTQIMYVTLGKPYNERKTFNRLIYIKRSFTLKELHKEVFAYLLPLFNSYLGLHSQAANSTNDDLFDELFSTIGTAHNQCPYELRVVNIAKRLLTQAAKCFFCEEVDCKNCLVPFTDELRVQDLINRMGAEPVRNDYYYFEHRYYNADKREFELEIIFNQDKNLWKANLALLNNVEEIKSESKQEEITIDTCLTQFSTWETLDKNNLWYCPRCKDSVKASKKMEILRCPPILIFHLKRFKIKKGLHSARLNALVDFPLRDLDLSPYVKESVKPPIYDLYAVTNHYGSIDFGHYTAFAINKGIWHEFDDSSVSRISEDKICSPAAYVLFYKLRGITSDIDLKLLQQVIPEDYVIKELNLNKSEEEKKLKDEDTKFCIKEADDVIAAKKEDIMNDISNDETIAQIYGLDLQHYMEDYDDVARAKAQMMDIEYKDD